VRRERTRGRNIIIFTLNKDGEWKKTDAHKRRTIDIRSSKMAVVEDTSFSIQEYIKYSQGDTI